MFSTKERLKKRTPENGIDREAYLEHLVEEYHTTTNVEAQEQVTANLANFAYDPINYEYLKKSGALELFLQLLTSPNDKLVLHGIAGICNLSCDDRFVSVILQESNLNLITNLLTHINPEVVINTFTTLCLITTPETRKTICTKETIRNSARLRKSTRKRVQNLAIVFLEKYCLLDENQLKALDNDSKGIKKIF